MEDYFVQASRYRHSMRYDEPDNVYDEPRVTPNLHFEKPPLTQDDLRLNLVIATTSIGAAVGGIIGFTFGETGARIGILVGSGIGFGIGCLVNHMFM